MSTKIYTGRTIGFSLLDAELMASFPNQRIGSPARTADQTYAEVNSAWLFEFYDGWRRDLFKKGVVAWDQNFDCNRYAASFAASAQIAYFVATFRVANVAEALAVGEIWFIQRNGQGHALILAHTERGCVFFEPQTGKEVKLTGSEVAAIQFKRF